MKGTVRIHVDSLVIVKAALPQQPSRGRYTPAHDAVQSKGRAADAADTRSKRMAPTADPECLVYPWVNRLTRQPGSCHAASPHQPCQARRNAPPSQRLKSALLRSEKRHGRMRSGQRGQPACEHRTSVSASRTCPAARDEGERPDPHWEPSRVTVVCCVMTFPVIKSI